ncbi:MAG: TspO/MBR family protein [Candidatus Algichlamydia australiensis]|nr:TspO/MBR family protein [Chlamydiales bacterium]
MVYGIGALGSYMTDLTVMNWYQSLNRPDWTPPDWLFGPVWMLLYFVIALVGFLLWKNRRAIDSNALFGLYWAGLIFNGLWTFLFFALKQPLAAAIDILFIWLFVLLFMCKAWRYKKVLTWLFLPYFLWITYAAAINWAIVYLNPK